MDWGLIGTILAIIFGIATIISIIIAIRLAKKRQPVWAYKTQKIIGLGTEAPPELKLLYNNQQVTDVYKTKIIFFNRGNEAILRDDVIRQVVINIPNALILREPIICAISNRETEIITVTKGSDSIELDFKYLDHNDGVVFELLHTKNNSIKCSANIIGAGEPRFIGEYNERRTKSRSRPNGVQIAAVSIIISCCVIFFGLNLIGVWITPKLSLYLKVIYTIFVFGIIIFSILYQKLRSLKFPKWSEIKD